MHVTASHSRWGPLFIHPSCLSGISGVADLTLAHQGSWGYHLKPGGASVFLSVFLQCLVKPKQSPVAKGCVLKEPFTYFQLVMARLDFVTED